MAIIPSLKYHALVGAFLSIWVFVLGFVVRPFEHGNPDDRMWFYVSLGFGILVFICYGIMSIVQKLAYSKIKRWSIWLEIVSYCGFYAIYTLLSYAFYRTDLILGTYGLFEFFTKIIFKSAFIFVPIMILSRKYLIKLLPDKEDNIVVQGANKLDMLHIKKSQLIAISNAQNYVEIFYLQDNKLAVKLIRSSLKKVRRDLDFLIQVHRSHLINPSHFRSWKNSNTIVLTQLEIPVSKSYKADLLAI
ncbi:LytTR family DNA-binding domain-containing protein [uncultured Croceitalea sp.]|uniref:LytTR family DNA-binding domain-containing protein n=1 Tax=uncultured Croceitalea sp. TaxID=1798908 RepID=UPI003305FF93